MLGEHEILHLIMFHLILLLVPLIASYGRPLLLYVAGPFPMRWDRGLTGKEINSFMLWARTSSIVYDKSEARRIGPQAVLIVDNAREFEYQFTQKNKGHDSREPFGGDFARIYIIPKTDIGAAHLNFLLLVDDDWEQGMIQNMLRSGYRAGNPQSIFPLVSEEGEATILGFMFDAKVMTKVLETANHNYNKRYRIDKVQ